MLAQHLPPSPQAVVLDTNVLISNILRRLFLRLAQHQCLSPVWGDYIGEEWRRNACRIWEIPELEAQQEWDFMQKQFPQANMGRVHKYETDLRQSDPKDWHVIACGIAHLERNPQQSTAIITWNTKDFHRSELRKYDLNLYTPDQVLCLYWRHNSELMLSLFDFFEADYLLIGKEPLSIAQALKRERLFRLSKLYEAKLQEKAI
ncbi:PIN domain-containing protein [Brackiella oedipodis]|uniref:PIN domain-containing protein n=1 Tax=Brackiella oedipodis TaxID=124225 RepID=UPI00048DBB22|nr:PIN domain-containing protein [Brackiella oedipodis]